tara:strand:+ start:798 stop:1058 length:261 start_codon:yes stop_codon:yes gene_type:complete
MKLDIDQLKDVAERAVMTYIQAVIGLWLAGTMTDMSLSGMKALAVAAAPGALSIVKGYCASVLPIGDKSASIVSTTPKPDDLTDDE